MKWDRYNITTKNQLERASQQELRRRKMGHGEIQERVIFQRWHEEAAQLCVCVHPSGGLKPGSASHLPSDSIRLGAGWGVGVGGQGYLWAGLRAEITVPTVSPLPQGNNGPPRQRGPRGIFHHRWSAGIKRNWFKSLTAAEKKALLHFNRLHSTTAALIWWPASTDCEIQKPYRSVKKKLFKRYALTTRKQAPPTDRLHIESFCPNTKTENSQDVFVYLK